MRWYELADNPQAISNLYHEVPELQKLRLRELALYRTVPAKSVGERRDLVTILTLLMDFSELPDKPAVSTRWKQRGYTALWLEWDLGGVESIQVAQRSTDRRVNICIEETGDKKMILHATASQHTIDILFRHFRIAVRKGVSGSQIPYLRGSSGLYQKFLVGGIETNHKKEKRRGTKWYELAENPQAIMELYNEVPELRSVDLIAAVLEEKSITLSVNISVPPDNLPQSWRGMGYDTVGVQLNFDGIESLDLADCPTSDLTTIHIDALEDGRIALNLTSTKGSLQALTRCFTIINIEGYPMRGY